MGKRKRPKKKPLTQEEIWDDSALVQSWDDAVEEYNVWNPSCTWCNVFLTRFVSRQLYHSIQARGESVDEVLKAEDARIRAEDEAAFGEHAAEGPPHAHPVAESESVDEEANDQDMEMEAGTDSHDAQQEASSARQNPEANRTAGGGFAAMPQLVSQGDDASSKFLSNYQLPASRHRVWLSEHWAKVEILRCGQSIEKFDDGMVFCGLLHGPLWRTAARSKSALMILFYFVLSS